MLLIGSTAVSATPELTIGDSLYYGEGHKTTIRIIKLNLGSFYTLKVANNTNTPYNITWEALERKADVDLDYKGSKFDINNNSLHEIELILIEITDGSVPDENYVDIIEFTYYLRLKYYGFGEFFNWIFVLLGVIVTFFIALLFIIALMEKIK
jgi:hypothetical protein